MRKPIIVVAAMAAIAVAAGVAYLVREGGCSASAPCGRRHRGGRRGRGPRGQPGPRRRRPTSASTWPPSVNGWPPSPRVAAVRVTRDYPSTLRSHGHRAAPRWPSVSAGGVFWLVAADGTVLDASTRRPPDLAPARGRAGGGQAPAGPPCRSPSRCASRRRPGTASAPRLRFAPFGGRRVMQLDGLPCVLVVGLSDPRGFVVTNNHVVSGRAGDHRRAERPPRVRGGADRRR